MKLTFLGTGTSYGVPYIGCDCEVCRSTDPRNKRTRCSILVEGEACNADGDTIRLLVDTTPDMRQQLIDANVRRIDAVLWTHSHNDHYVGLDDIRPLTDRQGYIDGYANFESLERINGVFDYIFIPDRNHGGFPRMTPHLLEPGQELDFDDVHVTAIPIIHGKREIFSYRFECAGRVLVYATDCSAIPAGSWDAMRGTDVLVLDALRHREHPTHFNIEQALAAVTELKPKQTYFTHIAHDLDHETTNRELPSGVELAYDGLAIEIEPQRREDAKTRRRKERQL